MPSKKKNPTHFISSPILPIATAGFPADRHKKSETKVMANYWPFSLGPVFVAHCAFDSLNVCCGGFGYSKLELALNMHNNHNPFLERTKSTPFVG